MRFVLEMCILACNSSSGGAWYLAPIPPVRLDLPIYSPSIAVLGVRKPRPTSLYHRRPPLPGRVLLALTLLLRKTRAQDKCQRERRPGALRLAGAELGGVSRTVRLLLESTLTLDGQFGGHLVGWWCRKMGVGVGLTSCCKCEILPLPGELFGRRGFVWTYTSHTPHVDPIGGMVIVAGR